MPDARMIETNSRTGSAPSLAVLAALSEAWSDRDPSGIADGLANAVLDALHPDLLYLSVRRAPDGAPIEVVHLERQPGSEDPVRPLQELMAPYVVSPSLDQPFRLTHPAGAGRLQAVIVGIGPAGAYGLLLVGSQRPGFPADHEQLVLAILANQAAPWLKASGLIADLRRRQEDLDHFFEDAAVPLHWVGPDGRILRANQAELELLGYAPEDYIGHHIGEFHADQSAIEDILRRLGRRETLHDYEARLRCKDGSIRDVLISSNVQWEDGRFIHTRCFTRDITEHRQADEALRASEARFRALANTVPAMVWSAAPDGTITYASNQWYRYSGLTPEQNAHWAEYVLHPDDADRCARAWTLALQNGTEYEIEVRNRRHDGQYRWFLTRAVPIRDDGGRVTAWYGTTTDIDDRKMAEQALTEQSRLAACSAKIAHILIQDRDLSEILQQCAATLVEALEAAFARIWVFVPESQILELKASAGLYTHLDGPHSRLRLGEYKIGRIAQARRPHLTNSVVGDPEVHDQAWAEQEGLIAFAGYPLILGDRLVGVIGIFARHALNDMALRTMGAVAEHIALGIVRKQFEATLRQQSELLSRLNALGQIFAAELNLDRLVQAITDSATELIGAEIGAYFYDRVDETGESFTLYTLSGAPHSAFADFPMPRATPLFSPTFHGTEIVRSGNIQQDPRYGQTGPHYGTPPGHLPVTSYLAVPVIARNGRTLGGLFFGHAQPNRFSERREQLIVGLAAQAAIALDNARLYHAQQQAREHLEARVEARSAELLASEARFHLLVNSVQDYAIYMLDPDGFVASWNTGAARIKGFAADEIIGQHYSKFYTPAEVEAGHPVRNLALAREHGHFEAEGWRVRKDGSRFWANVVISPVHTATGELVGYAKVTRDLSERRQMEDELRQSREQLRELSRYLERARENERRAIAREIHDELGGTLTGLKMDVTRLRRHIDSAGQQKLEDYARAIDAAVESVRRIATQLRPAVLDDFGVLAAMEWQLRDFERRSGITCHWHCQLDKVALPDAAAVAAFRVFQESLTNIARHAGATEVHATCGLADKQLQIKIEDNGVGITLEQIQGTGSLGLVGMRERVSQHGGTITIGGQPGAGTTVSIMLPVPTGPG